MQHLRLHLTALHHNMGDPKTLEAEPQNGEHPENGAGVGTQKQEYGGLRE